MSRNRAAPSLVGETDRHSRSGGPRGRAGGRAGGQGAGLAGRRTLGRASATVQVGGGGLFRFLRRSGEGPRDSKVGRRPRLPGPGADTPCSPGTQKQAPNPTRADIHACRRHARACARSHGPPAPGPPGPRGGRWGGWAAHLLKRGWASQQRLHTSSTPDSTTSVPPTKSDMTTTSST